MKWHLLVRFEAPNNGITFGQRETDYSNRLILISEWQGKRVISKNAPMQNAHWETVNLKLLYFNFRNRLIFTKAKTPASCSAWLTPTAATWSSARKTFKRERSGSNSSKTQSIWTPHECCANSSKTQSIWTPHECCANPSKTQSIWTPHECCANPSKTHSI